MSTLTATPAPVRTTGALGAQLDSEWQKVRSVRSTWVVIAVAALVETTLRLVSAVVLPTGSPAADIVAALKPSIAAPVLISLVPALLAGSEWRYGTAVLTYVIAPDRRRVVAAKAIMAAIGGASTALIITAIGLAVQLGVLAARGIGRPGGDVLAAALLGPVVGGALVGVIAVAVAIVVREQIAALALLTVLLFVVPLPALLLARWAYAITPSGLLDALAGQRVSLPELLPPAPAGLLLAALAAVTVVVSALVLDRRDIT